MFRWLKDRFLHSVDPETLRPSSVYRSGAGFSRWHIQCKNPYDLGPPADIILRAIQETRADMEATGDTRPLVILMGETHSMPAHVGLQEAVMSRMQQQKLDFSLRIELPHDFLTKKLAGNRSRVSYEQYDPEGRARLSCFATKFIHDYAPATSISNITFCLQHKITTIFNDAARNQDDSIDFDDDLTCKAANDLHISTETSICEASTNQMAIRNKVMASWPLEKDTILQKTGTLHIFGHNKNLPFTQSLTSTYEQAGARILPIFITTKYMSAGINSLPRDAYHRLPGCVLVDGLAEERFYSESCAAKNGFPHQEGAEARFITNKLHDSTAHIPRQRHDIAVLEKELETIATIELAKLLRRYKDNTSRLPPLKKPGTTPGPN